MWVSGFRWLLWAYQSIGNRLIRLIIIKETLNNSLAFHCKRAVCCCNCKWTSWTFAASKHKGGSPRKVYLFDTATWINWLDKIFIYLSAEYHLKDLPVEIEGKKQEFPCAVEQHVGQTEFGLWFCECGAFYQIDVNEVLDAVRFFAWQTIEILLKNKSFKGHILIEIIVGLLWLRFCKILCPMNSPRLIGCHRSRSTINESVKIKIGTINFVRVNYSLLTKVQQIADELVHDLTFNGSHSRLHLIAIKLNNY